MTRLESNIITVAKPAKEVFSFLSDFNNYQRLMPDQVADWESTSDTCRFTIKGMATLGMKMKDRVPDSLVVVEKDGKAPFDFTLSAKVDEKQGGSDVQLFFDADLNPMLKMMASKPLTNFLNLMAERLKEI